MKKGGSIGVYLIGNGAYYVQTGADILRNSVGKVILDPSVATPNMKGKTRIKWLPDPESAFNLAKVLAGWITVEEFEHDFDEEGIIRVNSAAVHCGKERAAP